MIIGVLRSLEVALGSLVLVHGIPSFAIFVVLCNSRSRLILIFKV